MKKIWNWVVSKLDGKKTFIYAATNLVLSLVPGSRKWMAEHPAEAMQLNGAIVGMLSALTKRRLKDEPPTSD